MPENLFSSTGDRCTGDTTQNYAHLGKLSTDELTEKLEELWASMDEFHYDPEQVDAYLAELEKREGTAPEFDVEGSLAAFHKEHEALFQKGPSVEGSQKGSSKACVWRRSSIAVVAAVIVLLCSVTVQGLGFDLFGTIARWTAEVFHFASTQQSDGEQPDSSAPGEDIFADLQATLDYHNIAERIVPTWVPVGFESKETKVNTQKGRLHIRASYASEDRSFLILLRQYDAKDGISSENFEKDEDNMMLYEQGDVVHYIMSNNEKLSVRWMAGEQLLCSISGDLNLEELQRMIDSIYRE